MHRYNIVIAMCSSELLGLHSVADLGFAQKGDRGERADRQPKRGSGPSGGGAPIIGPRGRALVGT